MNFRYCIITFGKGKLVLDDIKDIWAEVITSLKDEVSTVAYKSWIEPIRAVSANEEKMTLRVPFGVNKNMIMTKYFSLIDNCIEAVTGKKYELEVIVDEDEKKQENTEISNDAESALNPEYTFDTFVVGKNNNLAYSASSAVAERPGSTYNPLFLYGGSGLGKTHMMQAIGNYYREHYPDKKILYTTSEKFLNELIYAIREKTNQDFRDKYRNVDLLLIDDIQFLAKRELAQEEFFHTFNTLYEAGKQIVLTSDRLPDEIPQLEVRLISRFKSGLTADVQPPDFETRMAILKNKIQKEYLTVDEEILSFVADNIKSNVRELEGAVKKILLYAGVKRTNNITMDIVNEALKDILKSQPRKSITISLIIDEVEKYYHLSKGSLISKKKSKDIAYPRQIAMYICREILEDPSYPKIGEEFGGRDHSTVMHGVNKIKKELEENTELELTIKEVIANVKKA